MLLHPQFLYGLLGMAAPVLIHLLARRRTRRVLFPSLRFLQAAEQKRRALSRLRRPLSLLLRMLAIALLSLGLAAPVVGPVPSWVPLPRAQSLAIVLDDSLSMMGTRRGRSPFERAKAVADSLLSALGPGDRVALIRTSAPAEAAWASPAEAREQLGMRAPTAMAAKIAPALAAATDQLQQAATPNRSLFIITDMQATAWREPSVSGQGSAVGGIPVHVVDVGDKDPQNTAIEKLAALTSTAIVGRPVRLTARLVATANGRKGTQPQEAVVKLLTDDRAIAAVEREVAPDVPADAQFTLVPDDPRDLVVRAGIAGGPHGLAVDDARFLTIRARAPLDVVVCAPGGAARYLEAALDPFGAPHKSGIAPREVAPSDLTGALHDSGADVVILADCPRLERPAMAALEAHVGASGGVLVFLGDDADLGFLAQDLVPDLTGATAPEFGAAVQAPADAPMSLTDVETSREPLAAFANPRAGDIEGLQFTKAMEMVPGAAGDVLADFDVGPPAIVEWTAGKGHLILLNTSADVSWGRHIRSPAYVPLLHTLCSYLARPPRPCVDDVLVGERPMLSYADPVPERVAVVDPRGDKATVDVKGALLPEVKEPGAYSVRWDDVEVAFVANIDPQESDVTRTDGAAVRSALSPAQVEFIGPETDGAGLVARLATRADLSWPLLLAALCIMLVEGVFSLVQREGEAASGRGTVRHA